MRSAAVCVALALAVLTPAAPALADASTSSTTAPNPPTTAPASSAPATSSPASPATSRPPAPGPAAAAPGASAAGPGPATGATPATNVDTEVPQLEAQLVGLLDDVHQRMATLATQIDSLNGQVQSNQQQLAKVTQDLADRQADVTRADQRVAQIATDMAAAQREMRQRAVAAYIHQPAGEMANLVLHLRDPGEIDDIKTFYQSIVDAQMRTVARFAKLQRDAKDAAKAAVKARDVASRAKLMVTTQQAVLTSLRASFQDLQRQSSDQAAQQTSLLGQVNLHRAEFEAAVQQQQQESAQISAMLRQLETSATAGVDLGPAPQATSGFFQIPTPGVPITSPFGPRIDPILGTIGFHPGIDFGARFGTPIAAAADGTVVWAGLNGGYGNCTIIDHGHNMATLYAHQSRLLVQVGQQVTRGQVIGEVGSTGYSTGPHLHFEVRINGDPVNPAPYL